MRQRRRDRHKTEEGREMRQFKFVVFKKREGEKTHTEEIYKREEPEANQSNLDFKSNLTRWMSTLQFRKWPHWICVITRSKHLLPLWHRLSPKRLGREKRWVRACHISSNDRLVWMLDRHFVYYLAAGSKCRTKQCQQWSWLFILLLAEFS